ncbi:DUF4254 domain-containing protein [Nocardia arthritidis]|uniref:DUF4254 domain-containing protein n=1 Tax=Nocardia arthritidis TaxID=228602 RepID=A0A6G9YFX4_9NOCA|nr:DUF4254 domain-containing protein [Nocardia arthritidis]QIS11873.1 hypothetical protein F5544_20025 [Nocardia arthritidis]
MIAPDHVRSVLPSKDELLAALRGHYLQGPLCVQAYGLSELHRLRRVEPTRAAEIDCFRSELVAEIDDWVGSQVAPGARGWPESLGAMFDRMAAASDHAFNLLMTIDPGSPRMHAAWTRLAELEIAYGELVAAVQDGRSRLPG